jgi:hypothetical protein
MYHPKLVLAQKTLASLPQMVTMVFISDNGRYLHRHPREPTTSPQPTR